MINIELTKEKPKPLDDINITPNYLFQENNNIAAPPINPNFK